MKNSFYLTRCLHIKQIGISLVLSLILLFGFAATTPAYESFTATIAFYQGFTISNGMTTLDPTVITIIIGNASEITSISVPDLSPLFAFSPPVDVLLGLTTDPNYPIEVVAERIAGIVVLADTAFEDVTDDLLATLDFTEQVVSIDHDDLVVLLLNEDQDEYAMLGDVTKYPDATVHFTYWKSEIPEASTLVLLGVGIVGLIGIMTRTHINRSRKGGRCMNHIKTLLFALVLLPLLVGTISAAEVELRIITKGTGYGSVIGERIMCPSICKQTYEEGTVVQLKAVPFSDSRFGGWLIDGEPHEGVITIEKNTVVTAIFELIAGLDELTVYWYNDSVKEQATIATDEMVVLLEEREKWGVTTEEEFNTAVQEIVQQFHPQAEIVVQNPTIMSLKCPEPLAKDQWFSALSALKELKYVRYGGPMLYRDLEERWNPLMPTGQISVQFPTSYTEDQILAIEQEYGLVRQGTRTLASETFYYYQAGAPLESIDIANRLYESGKVEYATPGISRRLFPTAIPNDEYFAKKPPHYKEQWHLNNTQHPGEDIDVLAAWDLKDEEENLIRGTGVIIAIVDDGVEIDPIDDGVDTGHEDLQPNAKKIVNVDGQEVNVKDLNYDFIEGDKDPLDNGLPLPPGVHLDPPYLCPDPGCHGTSVAGIAGGVGFNFIGICGVAPEASSVGYRLLGAWLNDIQIYVDALTRNKDKIHIYNNSWGAAHMLQKISKDKSKALKDGVDNGRNGKGNIYVFGAGNTELATPLGIRPRTWNSNGDNYPNSRYTIAVASSDSQGKQAGHSAPGANILVNAPGIGILTTDLTGDEGHNHGIGWYLHNNYWKIFLPREGVLWNICEAIGTLEGNTYMTEQELLTAIEECLKQELKDELTEEEIEQQFQTYKETFLAQADFQTSNPGLSTNYCSFGGTSAATPVVSGVVALMLQMKPELGWRDVQHILIETAEKNDPTDDDWIENAAGYHFNHKYGAGRVDAMAAVELARDWIPLTERGMEEIEETNIGWGMGDFESDKGISDSISMGKFEGNLRVEFVEVIFTTPDHPQWTDLEVTLTSPEGTKSVLIEPHDPADQGKFSAWSSVAPAILENPLKGTGNSQ